MLHVIIFTPRIDIHDAISSYLQARKRSGDLSSKHPPPPPEHIETELSGIEEYLPTIIMLKAYILVAELGHTCQAKTIGQRICFELSTEPGPDIPDNHFFEIETIASMPDGAAIEHALPEDPLSQYHEVCQTALKALACLPDESRPSSRLIISSNRGILLRNKTLQYIFEDSMQQAETASAFGGGFGIFRRGSAASTEIDRIAPRKMTGEAAAAAIVTREEASVFLTRPSLSK